MRPGEAARCAVRLHGVADEDVAGLVEHVRDGALGVARDGVDAERHAAEVEGLAAGDRDGRFHLAADRGGEQGTFVRLTLGVGQPAPAAVPSMR